MTHNQNLHKKLLKPKQAKVSLDSLLGLLSSAYGTEQIDSSVVFQGNKINWQNLSVENFKAAPKKQITEEEKAKVKIKPIDKSSVGTSTTTLKPSKSESDVDPTLVTIRSLQNFKQVCDDFQEESKTNNKSEEEGKQELELTETQHIKITKPSEEEQTSSEMDDQNGNGDSLEKHNIEKDQQKVLCGIYVDDGKGKVVFDVQFMKKIGQIEMISLLQIEELEISLSILDISKKTKTYIKINKECLVSKAKYFKFIDDELGLENLDITVKCNLSVFNWIVQWIQADIPMCKPHLNNSNLKPVLLIAYHIKIDKLLHECLGYFHKNCKSVLETDWDVVDVLDDDLISQLVVKFSKAEIDGINDVFDDFKSRFYCALIRILGEQDPSVEVEHYSTLATLFQCGFCYKLFHYEMADSIPCRSDFNQMNIKGEIIPYHEQLPSWNISKYVELMFYELGSWKTVYWRLWGKCHFLECSHCKVTYPLEQNDWCSYHPEEVEYFPINQHDLYPIGTYKCCGQVAFRYNVLKPFGGCKFKSHSPKLDTEIKLKTYEAFQSYKTLISCQPPENVTTKKFVRLVKKMEDEFIRSDCNLEHLWWNGIRLAPKEKKDYSIISQGLLNSLRNRPEEKKPEPKFKPIVFKPPIHMGFMPVIPSFTEISEATCSGVPSLELLSTKSKKGTKQKGGLKKGKTSNSSFPGQMRHKKKKLVCTYQPSEYFWMTSCPIKDNQDNQRDFEEIAMRKLVKILSPDDNTAPNLEPAAGTYIRLEAEWWRDHGGSTKMAGSSKNSGTVVNRTYPLSWFRKFNL